MPQPGQIVGDEYGLQRLLGRGGFGEVWLATSRTTGSRVAIKFLTAPTEDAMKRFEVEARALRTLDSPFCARLFGSGTLADGTSFIATQYIDGEELGAWLRGHPSPQHRERIAADILRGLSDAHREGVVHRDLKPANILVCSSADTSKPVLIDFGLAKLTGVDRDDVTKTGVVLGTAGFMSPEQLRGERDVGPPADLYAFGALLYQMLSGRPPFTGETVLEVALKHLYDPVPRLPPTVPSHLARLVYQLLEKDPARRPSALGALRALSGEPAQPERTGQRSNGRLIAVAALGVATCAIAIGWGLSNKTHPTPPRTNRVAFQQFEPAPRTAPRAVAEADAIAITNECADKEEFPAGEHPHLGTWVRIPPDYRPTKRHRLVVLFHDAWQQPQTALSGIDYSRVGGARDYVIVAPQGNPMAADDHWNRETVQRAIAKVHAIKPEFCLDEEVVYLGYGHGGRAALRAAASDDSRALAVATFGHRIDYPMGATTGIRHGNSPAGTPVLSITPNADPLAPSDGSAGCLGPARPDLASHEMMLREGLACSNKKHREPDGCSIYTECPAPLQICVVQGGRRWPGAALSHSPLADFARLVKSCPPGPETSFPVVEKIWAFFDAAYQRDRPQTESDAADE